ncbi:peptidoglycan-binding protein [Limibaculum sp. M0105]|uniref:Peptidoglycan-binding protein n=1 Tax=Thermohalobaculum xanthum TaxID=2753746 RepID=A0A8J7MA02_9RHOB|nr:peptidoglycan-binding domain-containing protein [Thermohalobaculum xanthum]MBK0400990.1 peptidoglycan-binding protein [Thermohalobaculum xanthum]
MSWISLLIGAAVVSVSLSDPVIRLSDQVRSKGPIVVASDNSASLTLASVLPGPQFQPIGPNAVHVVPATPKAPAIEPEPVAPKVEKAPGPDHDAHLMDFMFATAQAHEKALGLGRAQRRELQQRLALIGYDPQGFDGLLGSMSRKAIIAWQRDFGFVETGYLDAEQIESLNERSAVAWAEWESERAWAIASATPSQNAPDMSETPESRDSCARGDDGRIVGKQSFGCDLKGVKEGFQRLFSKLGDAEATRSTPFAPTAVDR